MATPLNQITGMPQMTTTLSGWQVTLMLVTVAQSIVDGFPVDVTTEKEFRGTVQPLSPEAIAIKPEGQRAWQWLQIHVAAGVFDLNNNDLILYQGDTFKVMAKKDYKLNGYIEYHAVKDFT